jgi:hypothetical protein
VERPSGKIVIAVSLRLLRALGDIANANPATREMLLTQARWYRPQQWHIGLCGAGNEASSFLEAKTSLNWRRFLRVPYFLYTVVSRSLWILYGV